MKGVPVQEMITFIGTPTTEKGVIHGVGKGVVIALGDGVERGESSYFSVYSHNNHLSPKN